MNQLKIYCLLFAATFSLEAGSELITPEGAVLEKPVNGSEIAIWPPGTDGIDPDIPEQVRPCGKRFFDIHNPYLIMYKPEKPNGAAIILCAGGGYGYIASGVEGVPVAEKLNRSGITIFILKYRLPTTTGADYKHPVPLSDALRSVQLIRFDARLFEIDPDRIGVMGFSAGGHLAAIAGTLYNRYSFGDDDVSKVSSRPDFMCLVYPVISVLKDNASRCILSLVSSESDTAALAQLSAEKNVTGDTPPAFLVHARDDSSVSIKNSLVMAEVLKQHGVSSVCRLYEHGGHGFGIGRSGTDSMKWTDDFMDWLYHMKIIPNN